MRYKEEGEIHKDFHLAVNTTINWVLSSYGIDFLAELFRRTAQDVYAAIYQKLKNGDASEFIEHMEYFLSREGGEFYLDENDSGVILHIIKCPAACHIKDKYGKVPEAFHLQTVLLNNAWSQNTPFIISTDILGECECQIRVARRKENGAK